MEMCNKAKKHGFADSPSSGAAGLGGEREGGTRLGLYNEAKLKGSEKIPIFFSSGFHAQHLCLSGQERDHKSNSGFVDVDRALGVCLSVWP